MAVDITIPDFRFTGQYYPEMLEDLIDFLRRNCPELSDEDPAESHIQVVRAVALAFHLNSCLTDLVGNELFLPTAKLRASHAALLALIGVRLAQASPASVDLVAQLTTTFTAAKETVPAGAVFSTLETRAAQAVDFETLEPANTLLRTDLVGHVWAQRNGVWTDYTANAQVVGGTSVPTLLGPGDALYIGHPGVLWDTIRFDIAAGSTGYDTAVWEYFDGDFDQGVPEAVTNLGATLRFNVNSILGDEDRTGTTVRARSALTGAYQDLVVAFAAGENRITTAGADAFLGQSVPSTTVTDYIVGSDWRELSDLDDGSSFLSTTGTEVDVTYTLPQNITQNWRKTTINEGSADEVEAYWIRFRIIAHTASTAPSINQVRIHDGRQFQVFNASQGRTREDNPLGSSDGSASQVFVLSNSPVIDDDNIVVAVDEGTDRVYIRVDNFLNSVATDRHYTVTFLDDGSAQITFGDGVNGRIPPAGVDNIRVAYRTMIEIDGNVGKETISVNRSGVAYISNIHNPRAAAGYQPREGSTTEDLARLKIAGPATLRVRERAVSTGDVETVAIGFVADDGSRPVTRALAIEEAYGPKTSECVVVGAGGAQVAADKLSAIEEHFNGTEEERGRVLMNHQVTVTNFIPQEVDVVATVTGGNLTAVLTALTALLNPLAKDAETGEWVWDFGGTVYRAKITHAIMNTTPKPTNVTFTTPPADVALAARSLPIPGAFTITVV